MKDRRKKLKAKVLTIALSMALIMTMMPLAGFASTMDEPGDLTATPPAQQQNSGAE